MSYCQKLSQLSPGMCPGHRCCHSVIIPPRHPFLSATLDIQARKYASSHFSPGKVKYAGAHMLSWASWGGRQASDRIWGLPLLPFSVSWDLNTKIHLYVVNTWYFKTKNGLWDVTLQSFKRIAILHVFHPKLKRNNTFICWVLECAVLGHFLTVWGKE